MTAEAEQGFRPLDEASIEIKEVGEGNLNFVYIVQSEAGAIVVKQVRVSTPHSQNTRSSSLSTLT
jgi:5-methylthioribose kinase